MIPAVFTGCLIGAVFVALACFVLGFVMGIASSTEAWEDDLVFRGIGERYVVDGTSNKVKFRIKENFSISTPKKEDQK